MEEFLNVDLQLHFNIGLPFNMLNPKLFYAIISNINFNVLFSTLYNGYNSSCSLFILSIAVFSENLLVIRAFTYANIKLRKLSKIPSISFFIEV